MVYVRGQNLFLFIYFFSLELVQLLEMNLKRWFETYAQVPHVFWSHAFVLLIAMAQGVMFLCCPSMLLSWILSYGFNKQNGRLFSSAVLPGWT